MKLKHAAGLAALIAGIAALPVSSQAAPQSGTAGKPAPASSASDLRAEASRLLSGLQLDVAKAQYRADKLQVYSLDEGVNWESHASQLSALKDTVDDMGQRVYRLEQIQHAAAPWQQKAIDDTAASVKLMADNVADAIHFMNRNQEDFWEPAYRRNVDNVVLESSQLSRSVKNLEQGTRAPGMAGKS